MHKAALNIVLPSIFLAQATQIYLKFMVNGTGKLNETPQIVRRNNQLRTTIASQNKTDQSPATDINMHQIAY
jgi:hypothetical protein